MNNDCGGVCGDAITFMHSYLLPVIIPPMSQGTVQTGCRGPVSTHEMAEILKLLKFATFYVLNTTYN